MGGIDPTTGMAVFIVLAAIVSMASTVIRTIYAIKRSPPLGEDHAAMRSELDAIAAALSEKQDVRICSTMHRPMEETLREIRARHSDHESKISTQISDVHKRIDNQTRAIAANGAKLETFMEEIRNWRNHQ